MFFFKQTLNKLEQGTEVCMELPVLMGSKEAITLWLSLCGVTEAEIP